LAWRQEVEHVLRALLGSGDEGARSEAEMIVNRLVETGSLFARDLLSDLNASRQAPRQM
jgi:hypothetical protein